MENKISLAVHNNIKKLYHFQEFEKDKLEESRFIDILKNNRIYLSNPSDFNDPFEFQCCYNESITNNPDELEAHIEWATKLVGSSKNNVEKDDFKKLLRKNPLELQKVIIGLKNEQTEDYRNVHRVYSLGRYNDNILMWSHYADSHKGICLEFNTNNKVMCAAIKCEYIEDFPSIPLYRDDLDSMLMPMIAKHKDWGYENEYRLIALNCMSAIGNDTLKTDENNYLELPDNALVSVIIGLNCDNANQDRIIELIHQFKPQVSVKKAIKKNNSLGLIIQDLL